MKALPCACGDKVARLRSGEPFLSLRAPGRYACSACKRSHHLSPQEFNVLPDVTPEDLAQWGLLEHYTKDLRQGVTFTKEQAVDLFRAGFQTPDELPG